MKINHQWKNKLPRKEKIPKYIPMEQHEAILKNTQNNAYDYAIQLCTEMAMLALSEEFSFGEQRLQIFRDGLTREINHFIENVHWEFDSETSGLKFREREEKRPDLDYTMEEMDRRLEKIYPEGTFRPYLERYGRFGK